MIDDFRTPREKPKVFQTTPNSSEISESPGEHDFSWPKPPESTAEPRTDDSTTADEPPESPRSLGGSQNLQKQKLQHHLKRLTKKEWLVVGSLCLVLIAGGASLWAMTHRAVTALPSDGHRTVYKPKVVKPTTVPSTLTGLPVDPSVNARPVTGVMIENSPDARPQSGLNQAGVVFEAIAEGGITRFLALYQDTQPDYLGPVRSARPYYVQWAMGFDAAYAHVGGSPEALSDIRAWGVKDMDQFYNSGAYERVSYRYAPHNVYTSAAQLSALEAKKGYGASTFTGFVRKKDAPSKTPTAASINMNISGYYYNTHYDYDATTNSYKRSEGGAAHVELNKAGAKAQIQPKVVVAMVMQYGLEADDHHSQYNVIGSGQAFIFQDGTVTTGTWSKTAAKSQITFTDAAGKPIALNAGQTWLTALSAANQLTYK